MLKKMFDSDYRNRHPLGLKAEKSYRIVTVRNQTFQPFILSRKGFRQGIQPSDAADLFHGRC